MANTLIQAFMGLLSNFINLFVEPFFNGLSQLPGMSFVNDFITGVVLLFQYALEGGIFVKKFLLIPDGIFSNFVTFLLSLTAPWIALRIHQFVLRIYNLLKGLI